MRFVGFARRARELGAHMFDVSLRCAALALGEGIKLARRLRVGALELPRAANASGTVHGPSANRGGPRRNSSGGR